MSTENSPGEKSPLLVKVSKQTTVNNLQTPFKNNHNNVCCKSMIIDMLSSGKITKNVNCSAYKCKTPECFQCRQMEEMLKNLAMSPSSNFILHSPNSLEHYLESFSHGRINVMKLMKKKDETEREKREVEISFRDKENSNPNSGSKNNRSDSEKSMGTIENLERNARSFFSEKKFAKKNLMTIFGNENDSKLISRKIDRDNSDSDRDESPSYLNERRAYYSQSLKYAVLNSPVRKVSILEINSEINSESRVITTEKKKQVFLCSGQKTSSLPSSSKKISYTPTVHSTDKKQKTRCRKSSSQLQILKKTYEENSQKDWTKEMITEISQRVGLSENKVYKWFWDRKNKEIMDRKVFFIQNEGNKD